jgi:hypothetical protein
MVDWHSLLRWSKRVAARVLCSRKMSIGRQKVCIAELAETRFVGGYAGTGTLHFMAISNHTSPFGRADSA